MLENEQDTDIEVTHISGHGIWLLAGERELFLPCDQFSWFRDAPVGKILKVEQPAPGHFYWPGPGAVPGIESIEHPERFPLKAK